MTMVRVVLDDVICVDTEDVTGPDEFYLVGGISAGDRVAPVLTVPVTVESRRVARFGMGGGEVFRADLAPTETLRIGLAAFDEDAAKDWREYGKWATQIGDAVGQGLAAMPLPWLKVAGMIVPLAVGAVGGLMSLDVDDRLGSHGLDVPVAALSPGANPRIWDFQGQWGPVAWWSGWNYAVRYTIHVG